MPERPTAGRGHGQLYGANLTEYRTSVDTQARIISYGSDFGRGPLWWKVQYKSGLTDYFGETAATRLTTSAPPYGQIPTVFKVPAASIGTDTPTRTWALTRRTDTTGNFISYTYLKDGGNKHILPTSIAYGGNANTGVAHFLSVEIDYGSGGRPDVTQHYTSGTVDTLVNRIAIIRSKVNGTVVRQYNLSYPASKPVTDTDYRSRLASIEECGSSGWGTGRGGTTS